MEDNNGTVIKVTLHDIYNAVSALRDEVEEIGTCVKLHVQQPTHAGTADMIHDHEARIRVLDAKMGNVGSRLSWMFGAIAAAVVLGDILISLIK